VSTEAAEKRGGAAIHALPVNLRGAVLNAGGLARANLLQEASLAKQVFRLGLPRLLVSHLLLAVDKATEVRLLAPIAQVDRAAEVCKGLFSAVEVAGLFSDSGVAQNALFLCVDKSQAFAFLLKAEQGAKLVGDGMRQGLDLDLMLAAGAAHEGESDAQG